MVLDGVVGPAFQHFGDLSPLVGHLPVHHEQDPLFLFGPVHFLDFGIEVVVPSLSALLADALRQVLGDHGPLLGADLFDELDQDEVLLWCPGCLALILGLWIVMLLQKVHVFLIIILKILVNF